MADEPRDLGPSGARAPDDYEAKYMVGAATLYRDKIKAPGKFFGLLALPFVIQIISMIVMAANGQPVTPTLIGMPITALVVSIIGLLFSVLRITVTRKEVIVQYGLFGPRIPVASIQECKAVHYDWKTYGGWGIRRGRDGSWAYNMMGDAGRAVRIEWTNEKGKKQVTLVASPDPDALARSINEARAGGGARVAASPKARVAPDPRLAEFLEEAEAEAEAALLEDEKKEKKS